MDKVITIGRQYGSGGRDIGKAIAMEFGIPFYDNELISQAAKDSGFSEESFVRAENKATNSLLYSLAMGINIYGNQDFGLNNMSLDDRIFFAQSNIIRKVAKEGPCVIVGKCADYVLKDSCETFNLFIKADMDFRLKRAIEVYGDSPDTAAENIIKTDKARANYYKYHVGERWNDLGNYDLVIRSDIADFDTIVKGIVTILE